MQPTKLKYLEDSYRFLAEAKVLEIGEREGKKYVFLDETIFYPAGGGQPYDVGTISKDSNIFEVKEVRFDNGYVYHYGNFTQGNLNIEDSVILSINEERRKLHARIHSAGHLVDVALHELEYDIESVKGYHYPDGPYVEYKGEINDDRDALAIRLEEKMNELIDKGYEVHDEIVENRDQLNGKCYFIPEFLPTNKPIRVVYVCGPIGEPCGGTHVKNLKELGHVRIPKIKSKKGNTKVSYLVD